MNLYLNEKERKLKFLKILDDLLSAAYSDNELELLPISKISSLSNTYDPALEFIDYYCSTVGKVLDDSTKCYISNSLYAVKNTPEIENILRNLLGMPIHLDIDFPVLKRVEMDELDVVDPIQFINNLENLLFNLLYFTEINYYLELIVLRLEGDLTSSEDIIMKFNQVISSSDSNLVII